MKVILITLPSEGEPLDYTTPAHFAVGKLKYFPLGIMAVAGGISDKHDVRIFDAASQFLSIAETIAEINAWKPDVIGMTASIGTCWAMKEVLQKTNAPKKAVGGPHATHYAESILKLGANAVFKRDGDRSFGQWLEQECPDGVFDDYIDDLDSLPMPPLHLINLDDYAISANQSKKVLLKNKGLRFPMYSSKGCPFNCIFCDVQERRFRYKSPKRVVDEMELYLSKGCESVHIMDDCFNVREERVLAICDEIKSRNLNFKWSARGRAKIDLKTAEALKAAGCMRLHVGVESFDPQMLKYINKKITIEEMLEFFEICSQVEIETLAYLIIGFPGESSEYRAQLPALIRKAKIDVPFFNLLYPLPHTDYYEMLLKDNSLKEDFWKAYTENPSFKFEPDIPRTPALQKELEITVESLTREFFEDAK